MINDVPPMPRSRVFAVVPAAGFSRRMGQPKLLLPLKGRPVIARVLEALLQGGADAVYVLSRSDDLELQQLVKGDKVFSVVTNEPTADMRASVELLLRQVGLEQRPRAEDAWLLAPADHPVLNAGVVASLIEAWRAAPRGIVVPTHAGRRGHPTLFGWPFAEPVATIPPNEGLNRLLRDAPDQVREISVDFPEILQDLDTPDDYERLKFLVAGE
jgi:molybdenum cofactor cytidylyltransferase